MTYYFDLTRLDGATGIIPNPGDTIVLTGTGLHREPAKYRGCEAAVRFAEEQDLHFFYDDEHPELPLYTVPRMEVGGYDSRGGLIAGSPHFGLREMVSLYYIDRERKCLLIPGGENFPELGDGWRERLVPAGEVQVFASYAEAAEHLPILRPGDMDELMELLKGKEEP